jgi:1,4-dihydroxy-2-naphthoate polyprenyltransferase
MLDSRHSSSAIKKNSWKAWVLATRPKTLITSFAPIYTATALAYFNENSISAIFSLLALLIALFIQIGTNLINDSLDFSNGKDTQMRLGSLRLTQSGLLSSQHVYGMGIFCFCLALFVSIPLIIKGGAVLFFILIMSILSGYFYTGGPYPLSYHGLGELFVMIFFGWVITTTIYYIQTGTTTLDVFVLGSQMGLLATALISINNYRDLAEDTRSGKKTLAVRYGAIFAKVEIGFAVLTPFLLNLIWLSKGFFLIAFLPMLALPLAFNLTLKIWKNKPSPFFNEYLGMAAFLQLAFGFLLGMAIIIETNLR